MPGLLFSIETAVYIDIDIKIYRYIDIDIKIDRYIYIYAAVSVYRYTENGKLPFVFFKRKAEVYFP